MESSDKQEFLTTADAAKYLGLAVRTLEYWRENGRGPAFAKLGRAVRYSREILAKFAADRQCRSTAQSASESRR